MMRDLVQSRDELSRALARAMEERQELEQQVALVERDWKRRLRVIIKGPARYPKLRFVMGFFGGSLLGLIASLITLAWRW
jgi:hypothetical protein